MSYLCGILYESVVGSKRTSENCLETKSQNQLNSYKKLPSAQDNYGFLKKYCIFV